MARDMDIREYVHLQEADVEMTLEIQAEIPDGVLDQTVRTVTENCRTLKFRSHGFEKE